jgi:hypothetical protein
VGENAALTIRALRVVLARNGTPAAEAVNFLTLSWEGCNFG